MCYEIMMQNVFCVVNYKLKFEMLILAVHILQLDQDREGYRPLCKSDTQPHQVFYIFLCYIFLNHKKKK